MALDAEYLQGSVGDALTAGLANVVIKKPQDSVEFLGRFLIAFADNEDRKETQNQQREIAEATGVAAKETGEDECKTSKVKATDAALLAELQTTYVMCANLPFPFLLSLHILYNPQWCTVPTSKALQSRFWTQ